VITDRAVLQGIVDPSTRIRVAKLPTPLERSQALARLDLRPTDLQNGNAVTYSADRLADRNGELTAFWVSIFKQEGRWVIWSDGLATNSPGAAGNISVTFASERGKRYVVDFAIDSAPQQFVVAASNGPRASQGLVDGHLATVVAGTGGRQSVRIIPEGAGGLAALPFTLFYVKVTPLL
jgi:hypothetical protein